VEHQNAYKRSKKRKEELIHLVGKEKARAAGKSKFKLTSGF
jgi:hypothetical protein